MDSQFLTSSLMDSGTEMMDLPMNGGEDMWQPKDSQFQERENAAPGQSGQDKHNWDVRKILHLYMLNYCLQHNYMTAANAIANDTGIRSGESIPFGGDSADGLLLDWFTEFWRNFAGPQMVNSPSHSQPELDSMRQQRSPFGLASPIASTTMRRNETEPMKKSSAAATFGSSRISPGGSDSKMTTTDTAANAMQKMGWGDRSIDNLNSEERSKLVGVLQRSQTAQHQALQRMAATHQHTPLESSANRGFNGSAFQQKPEAVQQLQQQQLASPDMSYSSSQQHMLSPDKMSPPVQGRGHKKRRSSVSMSSLNRIQQLQQQTPASSREKTSAMKMGLAPSPSLSTDTTSTSYQAQSQVASRMTQQLDAQIAQVQNQLNRHDGTSEESKLNQISQLQALQGKLNQTVAGAGNERAKQQQQQQHQQHQNQYQPRSFSDMGPPPSTQFHKLGFSNITSNPPTPAMTASDSFNSDQTSPDWSRTSFNQYDVLKPQQQLSSTMEAHHTFLPASQTFSNVDFTNFDWSSLDSSSVL